ncbi:MAG: hypothetical protein J4N95_03435 [Chloroflexi bacterium]|nr:hypothetical protein [Chloroflexota bacterium]
MAERRFHFMVQDDTGDQCPGDIVIVSAWNGTFKPDPHASFTIVLSQRPLEHGTPAPTADNVAICMPASSVRLPAAVREARASYGGESPDAGPGRLPLRVLNSYAEGSIAVAHQLAITPREVFVSGSAGPRYDLLARALIARTRKAERCWRAINEALSRPDVAPSRIDEGQLRGKLEHLLSKAPTATAAEARARVSMIAGGSSPLDVDSRPAALAEDVAHLRCLCERRTDAEQLEWMRSYMEEARPHNGSQLEDDYPYTIEQLSFVALVDQPHLIDGMRATFEVFRSKYAKQYATLHADHWSETKTIQATLKLARPTAHALGKLNTLARLGEPVAIDELQAFDELLRQPSGCSQQDVEPALVSAPTCPACHLAFADVSLASQATDVIEGLEQGLAEQQTRLASKAVHRILGQGGAKLERFLQIVRAADLTDLALVLDDQLLAFLDELLAEPISAPPYER